jgi:short-subunit dehydrogenase
MGPETARLLIANGGTFVLVGRDQAKLAARKRELEDGSKGNVERSRPIYVIRKLWKP